MTGNRKIYNLVFYLNIKIAKCHFMLEIIESLEMKDMPARQRHSDEEINFSQHQNVSETLRFKIWQKRN